MSFHDQTPIYPGKHRSSISPLAILHALATWSSFCSSNIHYLSLLETIFLPLLPFTWHMLIICSSVQMSPFWRNLPSTVSFKVVSAYYSLSSHSVYFTLCCLHLSYPIRFLVPDLFIWMSIWMKILENMDIVFANQFSFFLGLGLYVLCIALDNR